MTPVTIYENMMHEEFEIIKKHIELLLEKLAQFHKDWDEWNPEVKYNQTSLLNQLFDLGFKLNYFLYKDKFS